MDAERVDGPAPHARARDAAIACDMPRCKADAVVRGWIGGSKTIFLCRDHNNEDSALAALRAVGSGNLVPGRKFEARRV